MNPITRRENETLAEAKDDDSLAPKQYHKDGIFVTRELSLGIEPRLQLSWSVPSQYWSKGFTLMLFRSITGFCPDKYPADLNRHGQLVAEATHDDFYEEFPEEGTYYFTFVLHKKGLLGLREKISVLRFKETIPSMKVSLGRIKDRMELEKLSQDHKLSPIEHRAQVAEAELRALTAERKKETFSTPAPMAITTSAINPVIAAQTKWIDDLVESLHAKRAKIADLDRDERFQKLSEADKKLVLDQIEERLDAGEISARREHEGS
jgi:hypothetical protein